VGHVGHHQRADFLGHGADPGKVDDARIGAGADDDELRPVGACLGRQLVVVEPLVVFAHAVRHDVEVLAREVQRVAVREVAAVGEVHAEDRVARLQDGQVDRHVGLRARMRLDVGVLGPEECFGPIDRQRLDDVHVLAAAVVALARVAFCVFVREDRSGGLENRAADEVLGRDELEAGILPFDLVPDGVCHLGVGVDERSMGECCDRGHQDGDCTIGR
jgi:hypothetical protein